MTRRESEWDQEQVDLALALEALNRDLGPLGELQSEATSEWADPTYYGPGSFGYVARGPFTNYAVKAEADARAAYRKEAGENANLNGMYWTVEKQVY